MIKNTASQRIGAQMVSATDGSAFTGSVTVSVTGDAGTQATGSVGSGACTHEGNGYHTYAPAQAETNYDLIAFTFTGTGAIPQTVQVFTVAGDAFTRLGAPAGASVSADIAAVKADTAAILVDTSEIGAAGAGLTNINLPNQTMDIVGNITGNLSGSVGSVTGAVGSVTGAVGSVTGNVGGNVTGSVGSVATGGIASTSFAAGAIDAAAIAANAIGASELAADAVTEIQAGLATSASISALNNLSAAQVNAEVVDALATDVIADSIPADGSRPTIAQALYLLTQFMLERSVSGTTMTVRKPDGSTTLLTLTLNDGTSPTSITRAS